MKRSHDRAEEAKASLLSQYRAQKSPPPSPGVGTPISPSLRAARKDRTITFADSKTRSLTAIEVAHAQQIQRQQERSSAEETPSSPETRQRSATHVPSSPGDEELSIPGMSRLTISRKKFLPRNRPTL